VEKTSLENLGFDEWFHDKSRGLVDDGFSLARIVEVNRNNYRVNDGLHEMFSELSGRFLFDSGNGMDFPTIGDWVVVQAFDDFSAAIIHRVVPRRTLLKRKAPGKSVDFQLIAANIDYALIVQAVDSNFNLNRLERYLVMINESGIKPVIVLTKIDLLAAGALAEIDASAGKLNGRHLSISNLSDQGIADLRRELIAGMTYCLVGPSGAGKTTLLNKLLGEGLFRVNEVREKDGKGRHTTVRRQLVRLDSGSIFIDTPGMKELGNFSVDAGIEETFDDIAAHGGRCRFTDCTHTREEGCAVVAAVEQGIIDGERYANFLKIVKESAYYEMSYFDKRKKDRAFGKMVKNYDRLMRKQ
jgi:ribosome biogenesis GTPase / thiamine phosphate phosphatase